MRQTALSLARHQQYKLMYLALAISLSEWGEKDLNAGCEDAQSPAPHGLWLAKWLREKCWLTAGRLGGADCVPVYSCEMNIPHPDVSQKA